MSSIFAKIQQQLSKQEAFLITKPANIHYLANFTGSNGTLLITVHQAYFFTDPRYTRVATKVLPKGVKLIIGSTIPEILKICKRSSLETIYFEQEHLTVASHKSLKKGLNSLRPSKKVQLKPSKQSIEELRIIKTPHELKLITKAQQLNDAAMQKVTTKLRYGMTEQEVAWLIEVTGRQLGADDISFEPIVGFGSNSGSPHHMNTSRKLKAGDMVLIDMGLTHKGYCSDMTRTYFTKKPTTQQAKIYNLVLEAQETAIKGMKAGTTGEQADHLARNIIKKAGYGKQFSHSLGHGIGLDVHELPYVSTRAQNTLPENTVVTAEPGIYLEKSFGVRIEDMVIIKANKAVNITKSPKNIADVILSVS